MVVQWWCNGQAMAWVRAWANLGKHSVCIFKVLQNNSYLGMIARALVHQLAKLSLHRMHLEGLEGFRFHDI